MAPGWRNRWASRISRSEIEWLLARLSERNSRLFATDSSIAPREPCWLSALRKLTTEARRSRWSGYFPSSSRRKSNISPLKTVVICSCRSISGAISSCETNIWSKSCWISLVNVSLLTGSSLISSCMR